MTTLLLGISEFFDLKALLFGGEDGYFLAAVAFRVVVMFIVVLASLRILGKRGVKQLSIFELVIILTLGSASGDPMFYHDVGLLVAMVVFIVTVGLYRLVVYLSEKSEKLNRIIEGRPICLVEEGKFCLENFGREPLAYDEFFAIMRLQSVSHLGQVYKAYLETSGEVSLFYYPDEKVTYGLPILPELNDDKYKEIIDPGHHSCGYCGYTQIIKDFGRHECPVCRKDDWVKSIKDTRIV